MASLRHEEQVLWPLSPPQFQTHPSSPSSQSGSLSGPSSVPILRTACVSHTCRPPLPSSPAPDGPRILPPLWSHCAILLLSRVKPRLLHLVVGVSSSQCDPEPAHPPSRGPLMHSLPHSGDWLTVSLSTAQVFPCCVQSNLWNSVKFLLTLWVEFIVHPSLSLCLYLYLSPLPPYYSVCRFIIYLILHCLSLLEFKGSKSRKEFEDQTVEAPYFKMG